MYYCEWALRSNIWRDAYRLGAEPGGTDLMELYWHPSTSRRVAHMVLTDSWNALVSVVRDCDHMVDRYTLFMTGTYDECMAAVPALQNLVGSR